MISAPARRGKYEYQGSGLIDRPRLIDKLKKANEHRLTLISAPPGYGKTTLAAQFARRSQYPVAWHTLEERERDVPNLYLQSLSALAPIVPGIKTLPPPYGYAAPELAAFIADYLRDNLPADIAYILDDVQRLAGAPAAETWLRALVTLLPPTCHLILISRILPPLPLVEMIARREVLAIGQEELKLTPQEVYDLGAELLGVPPASDQTLEIATRLEGWPAGTVLAFHPLPADLERAVLSGGEGPEALFDALAQSMLDAQPPPMRDFLLISSTLTRLTPVLCAAALRITNSNELLAEAQTRNLFLVRASGGLVYHTLFRNFLQRKLSETQPDLFTDLHQRAAAWFEADDQIEEAVDHFLAANQIDKAAEIAERVASSYFAQGKVETLLKWGAQLGTFGIPVSRLLYRCAIIHTDRYEYETANAELDRVEVICRRTPDESGMADVLIQRAMIQLYLGQYQDAADLVIALMEKPPDSSNIRGRALNMFGLARLRMDDVETAIHHLEEALPLYRENGDAYALSQLLQNLGVAYSRFGCLDEANACLQEVVALQRSLGSAGALALALNNLGYYYHRGGDYKQALATLQEGLSVISQYPNRRAETYLLWSLGDLQADRGAFDEALDLYNRALEQLGGSEPTLRCSILVSMSTIRRWQGKLPEADALAAEACALSTKHGLVFEGYMAQAALWATRALAGDAAAALERLNMIIADLRTHGAQYGQIQVLGLCALAALLCADETAAVAHILAAMKLGRELGSAQPLVTEIFHTPRLEALIKRQPLQFAALNRDLKALRDVQLKMPDEAKPLAQVAALTTYSLRVRTLGQENILRDGQPVPLSEWRAITARELFFYLLFEGARTREDISLVFWPDSLPRRVRSNFHTTLYRARQALGENAIAFKDEMYLINPEVDVWCDAHELESLATQARLMSPYDARTEDLWRRAAALYRGDLLPSIDAVWIATRREELYEIYMESLIGLGECARARHDFREAVNAFRHALTLEPFREDIHRAIMTCYAARGERQKVVTHLRELERLLHRELAVEPSQETLQLVATLLA